jgi:hypothetical protein
MSKFTPEINQHNVEAVRYMIKCKNSSTPYHATEQNAGDVLTDFDHFPYNRFYRGVFNSPRPVVIEREAGWRARQDDCYDVVTPPTHEKNPYPNHCFESACSTVYPCYPDFLTKFADRDALNVMLNKACIVQYR